MGETQQTEWDSSKATLMRIDDTLKRTAQASYTGDLWSWFKELQVLKREAYPKMNKKGIIHAKCATATDKKEYCMRCHCNELFAEIETDMTLYQKNRGRGDFGQLQEKLDEAELFLREFMDGKGMLMRDQKSAMDKFQEG